MANTSGAVFKIHNMVIDIFSSLNGHVADRLLKTLMDKHGFDGSQFTAGHVNVILLVNDVGELLMIYEISVNDLRNNDE